MRSSDLEYMQRAIEVARGNVGRTAPNPCVGCVIVRDGDVLAEACTAEGGRPHAEEQALEGVDARGATAYVTLEPCGARSAGGLSCSDRLVAAGVARVVVACEDASPYASGQGAERLRAAGVAVEIGLCADEALAALRYGERPDKPVSTQPLSRAALIGIAAAVGPPAGGALIFLVMLVVSGGRAFVFFPIIVFGSYLFGLVPALLSGVLISLLPRPRRLTMHVATCVFSGGLIAWIFGLVIAPRDLEASGLLALCGAVAGLACALLTKRWPSRA
ncbi:MAG TPA: hypothetical protein VF138_07280 [Caulobacteraceae bacterium]